MTIMPRHQCVNCGAEVSEGDWDYLGHRRVHVCSDSRCIRELRLENQALEDHARLDAEEDRYGRYY